MREISLRTRVSRLLMAFGLATSVAVVLVSLFLNERLERSVWHTLLTTEAMRLHSSDSASAQSVGRGQLRVYPAAGDAADATGVPAPLPSLAPGFHDEVLIDGRENSVLVLDDGSRRSFLTYDTSKNEQIEQSTWNEMIFFGLLFALTIWGTARVVATRTARSVLDLAAVVRGLSAQERIPKLNRVYPVKEVSEIAASIDGLLDRIQGFVEREREFINAVSHELTTPIAVIAGAADVLTATPNMPQTCRPALQRVDVTARSMNDTLRALMFLAREPQRAARGGETCRIDLLLEGLIESLGVEFPQRSGVLRIGAIQRVVAAVAPGSATIVFGNLIRNALQHSLADTIEVRLERDRFVIRDNGSGMSADAISRAYSSRARSGASNGGGGLGLTIVQRVCSHIGWRLSIDSCGGDGTVVTVEFAETLAATPTTPISIHE